MEKAPNQDIPPILGNTGLIGRFKPLHNGAFGMLEEVCRMSQNVMIGIGSSNIYDLRNPFTAKESQDMIDLSLSPRFKNYRILQVPDFAHVPEYSDGSRWKEYVVQAFGMLDHFITSNPYVIELLKDSYHILPAFDFIPPDKRTSLKATLVRQEIARYGEWEDMVPGPVSRYLKDNGIIDRFRGEFGLATVFDMLHHRNESLSETAEDEKRKISGE